MANEDKQELVKVEAAKPMSLDAVRSKLAGKSGKKYWRSLDELAGTPEFDEMLKHEFPERSQEWIDPVSRRGFLKLMGASMALAGLAGCTKQPDEAIYPYVKQPEDLILGKPMYFASAFPFPSGAIPVLIKSDSFRPIKVDGNPDSTYNRGGSDVITQSTLLDLYDPDRSKRILHRGEAATWAQFLAEYRGMLADKKSNGGQGLYFLSATVTSPTMAAQWKQAQQSYPQAKFIQYDPVNRDAHYAATKQAFGDYADLQYRLDQADVVVSLDADFLGGAAYPGFHKVSRDFINRRKLDKAADGKSAQMSRLYVVEGASTTTGLKADHRLVQRTSAIPAFAAALAAGCGAGSTPAGLNLSQHDQTYLDALVKDLKASAGKSVVIPGEFQPAEVHLAAYAINQALGNFGKTVVVTDTVNPMPSIQTDDLKSLVADMNAGKVDWLVMLNVNPVYSAPADLEIDNALPKVKTIVHLGSHPDETAQIAHWHINGQHYLESWSDARAYDGTVTVIQPMIDPLYGGHSAHEILQSMLADPDLSPYAAVRSTWIGGGQKAAGPAKGGKGASAAAGAGPDSSALAPAGDPDIKWRKILHDGFIENTAFQPKSQTPKAGGSTGGLSPASPGTLELIFRPDAHTYDGRYANVGWLQEIPRPVTSLSWDNAALLSMETAAKLNIDENEAIEITYQGRKVIAPALVVPGHADDSITIMLGQGRRQAGRVGGGVGYNGYLVRSSGAPWLALGASVRKTGQIYDIAVTKSHHIDHRATFAGGDGSQTHSLEGNESLNRGIIRYASLEEFRRNPDFAHEGVAHDTPDPDTSMFPAYRYDQHAWGMSIDLNSCIGCNACIAGCYAENNLPVVGRHQVKVGRIMQWIRIDTYFEGDLASPRAHFQPMTCHQCENAPCEQVCPVGATIHSPEGLNVMVYNRCVGTRYCSNNCPYKVRRFNFLLYSDYETESLKLMRNPDVSVRSRGVMEKCSYCTQRIMAARIDSDKNNRPIAANEIQTACQQACPTDAIVFGDINNAESRVAKLKAQERNYGVLADLNTRPRTTYLAEVINFNEELAGALHEFAPEQS